MQPDLYHIIPTGGAVIMLACLVTAAALRKPAANGWAVAALLAALFALCSTYAVATGGPLGFWTEHVRNAWGNQIWLDLLCAAATAFIVLLPRARAAGMAVWVWLAFVIATGSLGLLAMLARCLWLEGRARQG